VKAWRIILAIAGIALAAFGVFRLVSETPVHSLLILAVWLIAALVLHDAILAPSVVGVGWLLRRYVPDRGRRFLQVALIMSAFVIVIAIPMILLRGSQPAEKALLLRNYGANLILLLSIIAIVSLILYAVQVVRDRYALRQGTSASR
jgi:NADH:ubiquinone oxidoreductase subunit 6 (subunit J)